MKKKIGIITAILLGSLLSAAALTFFFAYAQIDISKLEDPLPQPTIIFDRTGKEATKISSSKIEPAALNDIPIPMQNAIIATEDQRFYEHNGVDIQSILRALVKDIKAGEVVEGGSTITQQLTKNMLLNSEQTISRKLKEAITSVKIEMTYSKNEILELYLNHIYFGEGAWGVQQAAQTYFGKNISQVSIAEAAMLAALPKAPSFYSPYKHPKAALERRNLVLKLMLEQGYVSNEEYEAAVAQKITLLPAEKRKSKANYPSYVDYVLQEAEQRYGLDEDQILTMGLHIYTELDPKIQQAAEKVYSLGDVFPDSVKDQWIQSGIVLEDPHTGGIKALVGQRGEHVFRGFNHATQLRRQPGSAIKPLVVYGPALEAGFTPQTQLYDGPLDINGYSPHDWDSRTRGTVTLQEALRESWNIPAVWTLNELGISTGFAYGQKLGLPLTQQDRNLGLALGGLSKGVSPLEMAQAFSVFPALGEWRQAHAIVKITAYDGTPLIEYKDAPIRLFKPTTAYTMTGLLQNVVANGTGQRAQLTRPTAGKTGTTQLPETKEFQGVKGIKDAWFVGYTPELVAAVWMGYDKTDKDHVLNFSGGYYPAMVFKAVMEEALRGVPVAAFERPDDMPVYAAPTQPMFKLDGKPRQEKGKGRGHGKKDR